MPLASKASAFQSSRLANCNTIPLRIGGSTSSAFSKSAALCSLPIWDGRRENLGVLGIDPFAKGRGVRRRLLAPSSFSIADGPLSSPHDIRERIAERQNRSYRNDDQRPKSESGDRGVNVRNRVTADAPLEGGLSGCSLIFTRLPACHPQFQCLGYQSIILGTSGRTHALRALPLKEQRWMSLHA